jgi:hypothetical protein
VKTAIKAMDGLKDDEAQQIIDRIDEDEVRTVGTVSPNTFNDAGGGAVA